jgi:hypothetical protein
MKGKKKRLSNLYREMDGRLRNQVMRLADMNKSKSISLHTLLVRIKVKVLPGSQYTLPVRTKIKVLANTPCPWMSSSLVRVSSSLAGG